MNRLSGASTDRDWLSIFDGLDRPADLHAGSYELVEPDRARRKPAKSPNFSRLIGHPTAYQRLDGGSIDISDHAHNGGHIRDVSDPFVDRPVGHSLLATKHQYTLSETPLFSEETSYQGHELNPNPQIKSHSESRQAILNPRERRRFWNPVWLHGISLMTLAALFLVLVAGVLLLWHFAQSKHGYVVNDLDLGVLWTYGPTFVLIIIVSLWRQVEYFCKMLTPWQMLQKGNAPASKSLLLDYVSPWTTTSFARALQNRHMAVVFSVLGFWILKLTVVASSSLLVLGPVTVTIPAYPVRQTTRFDFNNFTTLANDPRNSMALFNYLGVLSGTPLPPGSLANNDAFAQFEPVSETPANSVLQVQTQVFSSGFDCEQADIFNLTTSRGFILSFNFSSSTCKPQAYLRPEQDIPAPAPLSVVGSHTATEGAWDLHDCNGGDPMTVTSDTDLRWVIFAWNRTRTVKLSSDDQFQRFDRPFGSYIIGSYGTSYVYHKVAAVICKPSYKIQSGTVSQDRKLLGLRDEYTSRIDPHATMVNTGVSQADFTLGVFNASRQGIRDAGFLNLVAKVNGQTSLDSLVNGVELLRLAPQIYNGLSAQFLLQQASTSAVESLQGLVQAVEQRLFAGSVSIWLLLAGFACLFLLTISVFFSRPWSVVPYRPDAIFPLARILKNSPALQQTLLGTGNHRTQMIAQKFCQEKFSSVKNSGSTPAGFGIHVDQSRGKFEVTKSDLRTRWHVPTMAKTSIMVCVIALPLVFIAVLEIIQQLSNRNNGFIALPRSDSAPVRREEVIRLISALIMVLLAALYTSLDFVVSKYTPFAQLKKGHARSENLKHYLVGNMPPVAIWRAARSHQWGSVLATSAALVASLLAMVVSGLFVVREVEKTTLSAISTRNGFDVNWINSVNSDNSAALTLSLIENYNLSDPKFTYGELALPILSTELLGRDTPSDGSKIIANVPAWRAALSCSVTPREAVQVHMTDGSSANAPGNASLPWVVSIRSSLPASCQLGGPAANLSYIEFNSSLATDVPGSNFVGNLLDLHFGPYNDTFRVIPWSESNFLSPSWLDNPAGCPSLAFTFGSFDFDDIDSAADRVTSLVCSQNIQEVMTETTLIYPDMEIDSSTPPKPDENSVRTINVTSVLGSIETAMPYRIEQNLNSWFDLNNNNRSTSYHASESPVDTYALDSFFSLLLHGKDSVDPTSISGPENVQQAIDQIEHMYRRYMAQAIAANMRVELSNTVNYDARVRDFSTNHRVFVVTGPKIALQAMIGFMVVAGGLAYVMTPLQKVLMHNPLTIAGAMSLLAGSRMCDPQFENTNADRRSYRLGWWRLDAEEEEQKDVDDKGGQRFGIDFHDVTTVE